MMIKMFFHLDILNKQRNNSKVLLPPPKILLKQSFELSMNLIRSFNGENFERWFTKGTIRNLYSSIGILTIILQIILIFYWQSTKENFSPWEPLKLFAKRVSISREIPLRSNQHINLGLHSLLISKVISFMILILGVKKIPL